jgi:hypothetical protein
MQVLTLSRNDAMGSTTKHTNHTKMGDERELI